MRWRNERQEVSPLWRWMEEAQGVWLLRRHGSRLKSWAIRPHTLGQWLAYLGISDQVFNTLQRRGRKLL